MTDSDIDLISTEVDAVVQNYFSALSEKDNDIFRLYADNQRMKHLVEDALAARGELESSYRSQSSVVTALTARLQDEHAQRLKSERECAVWCEGAGQLRAVMARMRTGRHAHDNNDDGKHMQLLFPNDNGTSTSQPYADLYGASAKGYFDAVEEELSSLVSDRAQLQDVVQFWYRQASAALGDAFSQLEDAERRERRQLDEAAMLPLQSSFSHFVRFQSEALLTYERETLARIHSLERMCSENEERHALQLQRLHFDHQRATVLLEDTQRMHKAQSQQLDLERILRDAAARMDEIAQQELHERAGICMRRCEVAEKGWRQSSYQLKEERETTNNLTRTLTTTRGDLDDCRSLLESQGTQLVRARKQADRLESTQQQLRACGEERDALSAKCETLSTKNEGLLEKLRISRQQHQKALHTIQQTLADKEEQLTRMEQKCNSAQFRLQASEEECTSQKKRLSALEKKAESLARVTEELAHERQSLSTANKALEALQEREKHLTAEIEIQEKSLKERAEALETAQHALEETVARLKDELSAQCAAAKEEKVKLHAHFSHEVSEWVSVVDKLRDELSDANDRIAKERAARLVLEQQQQQESGILLKIMNTSAIITTDASLVRAEEEVDSVATLRHQVGVLEEACRRSAAVIADLRESVYRERTRASSTPGASTIAISGRKSYSI